MGQPTTALWVNQHQHGMTAMEYLAGLRPALPFSAEKPCIPMSNGELRRTMIKGSVLFNGETVTPDELIDFPVFSLVFFPKSVQRKTTII